MLITAVLILLCLFLHIRNSIEQTDNFLSSGIKRIGEASTERHEKFRLWLDTFKLSDNKATEAEQRLEIIIKQTAREMNLAEQVEFDDVFFRYLTFRDPIVVIPSEIQHYFAPDRVAA